jgi:hypothetical protein
MTLRGERWEGPHTTNGTGRPSPRSDAVIALLVGGIVLVLYVRTLFPHVGGTEDSPKFQYLGHVLGTAHSPGYPLYILISHLFSRLPIDPLAYRITLMSACFGAATAACVFLILRHFRCHPMTAALVAAAFAAGRYFWANAVIAEVYTLNAALWAVTILKLLHWKTTTRARDLYFATGAAALALGNHLTIVALFPAMLAFVALAHARWVRVRHVLACLAILIAGLSQYGFIWLRTAQEAPYLESRASNLRELYEVITARRFANAMFAYDLPALVTERIPALARMVAAEMGVSGAIFTTFGLALLLRRRLPDGVLLILSALGVFAMTLNVFGDAGGFLLPVFLVLWIAAGVGLEGARLTAARLSAKTGGIVAFTLIALIPASQLVTNYRVNDRHDATFSVRYLEALLSQLPVPSALVNTDYYRIHLLQYAIVSGEFDLQASPPRAIDPEADVVRSLLVDGVSVFSFERELDPLRGHGLAFTPFELRGTTLEQYVATIDNGRFVALAGSGATIPEPSARVFGARALGPAPFAMVGVKGATQGALQAAGTEPAALSTAAGTAIGVPPTVLLVETEVVATGNEARVRIGQEDVLHTTDGIGVVVFDQDGRIADRRVFDPARDLTTTFNMGPWPLHRVTFGGPCVALGDNEWHDITSIVSTSTFEARLDNFRPFDASIVVYAESDRPLAPAITFHHEGCHAFPCPYIYPPALSSESFMPASDDGLERLRKQLEADGLNPAETPVHADNVTRTAIAMNDQGQFVTFALDFRRAPTRVLARAVTDVQNPNRARVCAPATEAQSSLAGNGT